MISIKSEKSKGKNKPSKWMKKTLNKKFKLTKKRKTWKIKIQKKSNLKSRMLTLNQLEWLQTNLTQNLLLNLNQKTIDLFTIIKISEKK